MTHTSVTDLTARVAAIPYWFHSIDLGNGIVTRGVKTPDALRAELASLALPDLCGKSVLDIGAWDGFYSFEAERRGASRVVALDHFMWSIDAIGLTEFARDLRMRGEPLPLYEQTPYWRPHALPGKRGFDLAREVLGSHVESVVDDFMTMDLRALGTFDVVLYLGVLYHMRHPLLALERLAQVARELVIIETHAIAVERIGFVPLCQFYEGSELNSDSSNWWGPTAPALIGMCRAAGFRQVDLLTKSPRFPRRRGFKGRLQDRLRAGAPRIREYRLVAHARK